MRPDEAPTASSIPGWERTHRHGHHTSPGSTRWARSEWVPHLRAGVRHPGDVDHRAPARHRHRIRARRSTRRWSRRSARPTNACCRGRRRPRTTTSRPAGPPEGHGRCCHSNVTARVTDGDDEECGPGVARTPSASGLGLGVGYALGFRRARHLDGAAPGPQAQPPPATDGDQPRRGRNRQWREYAQTRAERLGGFNISTSCLR